MCRSPPSTYNPPHPEYAEYNGNATNPGSAIEHSTASINSCVYLCVSGGGGDKELFFAKQLLFMYARVCKVLVCVCG